MNTNSEWEKPWKYKNKSFADMAYDYVYSGDVTIIEFIENLLSEQRTEIERDIKNAAAILDIKYENPKTFERSIIEVLKFLSNLSEGGEK